MTVKILKKSEIQLSFTGYMCPWWIVTNHDVDLNGCQLSNTWLFGASTCSSCRGKGVVWSAACVLPSFIRGLIGPDPLKSRSIVSIHCHFIVVSKVQCGVDNLDLFPYLHMKWIMCNVLSFESQLFPGYMCPQIAKALGVEHKANIQATELPISTWGSAICVG